MQRRLISLAAMILLAACSGGDKLLEPAGQSIAGTYHLKTANEQPPPFVMYDEDGLTIEVMAASYGLTNQSTFTTTATFRLSFGGETEVIEDGISGTYTRSGSSVVFRDSEGDSWQATVSGDHLTFHEDDVTLVFSR